MSLSAPSTELNPLGTVTSASSRTAATADTTAPARRHGDKYIWGIFILLCCVSLIELYSASSREVASAGIYGPILRHSIMLVAGVGIVWSLEKVHYKWFFGFAYIFAAISVIAMLYVSMFGDIINGARRSFTFLSISLQPAEFIKMSAVLVIAKLMARSQKAKGIGVENRGIILSALVVLFFGALLFKQGLTNTILLMSISLAMMLLSGTEFKKLLCVLAAYAVIALGALMFKPDNDSAAAVEQAVEQTGGTESVAGQRRSTWESRLERFFSSTPKYEEPINSKNRQEQYAYMAQANGGLIGVFPGNSRETARLPLAFSDYIYAIILEDLGFVGGMAVLILYLWLLARAGIIARKCHRAFPVLLVMGMAVMIVLQALFHMAITTGAFPVSGQPLPMISKGGTSILITSIAFGAMLSVSRSAVQNGSRQAVKQELNDLPEELRAENPVQL